MEKTVEQEKEELISQAKLEAAHDINDLQINMQELLDRIFHFAYEKGYERGYADATKTDLG